jgi:hypothetical protein
MQIQAVLGAFPTPPVAIPPGALAQSMRLLEAARPTGDARADAAAKQSGFSDRNSGGAWRGPTVDTTRLSALTTDATNITAQARPISATLPAAPSAVPVPAMATVPLPPPPPPVPPTSGPGCVDGSFSHHHHHHHARR